LPLPFAELLAGPLQNPQAQRNDQAGILGQRNKVGRINKPALGMLPTNQRFKAGELSVLERDDRLVVNAQLFAIDRRLSEAGNRCDGSWIRQGSAAPGKVVRRA
jgi:hypothetical protein